MTALLGARRVTGLVCGTLIQNPNFCASQSLGSRGEQEDSYGICYETFDAERERPVAFILADGMGGHVGGSVASQTVVDSVKVSFSNHKHPGEGMLLEGLEVANSNLAECLNVNPDLAGMGTTLLVTICQAGRLSWLSIGDSPLLGIDRDFEVRRLNEDHSMKPVLDGLVQSGVIEAGSEEYRKKSNQLRSALVGEDIELFEVHEDGILLSDFSYILLASDGIETLSMSEIGSVAKRFRDKGVSGISLGLMDAIDSKHAAKQDNVSIIVLNAENYAS